MCARSARVTCLCIHCGATVLSLPCMTALECLRGRIDRCLGRFWWSREQRNMASEHPQSRICLEQSNYRLSCSLALRGHGLGCALPHNTYKERRTRAIGGSSDHTSSHSWYNDLFFEKTQLAAVIGQIVRLVKMLAGRILPPIHPRSQSPPLATFYNIPRRYARSSMQAFDDAPSQFSMDSLKSSRPVRTGNRPYELRSSPTSNPIQRLENELPSPVSSTASAKNSRKRSQDYYNNADPGSLSDPENLRGPDSASSSPGEHVCLCQPEPKIPRPRNGKSALFFIFNSAIADSVLTQRRTKASLLCLRTCIGGRG